MIPKPHHDVGFPVAEQAFPAELAYVRRVVERVDRSRRNFLQAYAGERLLDRIFLSLLPEVPAVGLSSTRSDQGCRREHRSVALGFGWFSVLRDPRKASAVEAHSHDVEDAAASSRDRYEGERVPG